MAVPRIITLARAKLSQLISSTFFRYARTKGLKAIRTDYAQKFIIVLDVMLQGCCLEFDGQLCRIKGNLARPLTVPEMATLSHINQRTLERIIHDLKDMGLLQSEKQFKRFILGGLKVAAVWRVFTRLFWEKLGLWGLFVESVQYAAKHAHLKLKNPLKSVGKKKARKMTDEEARQRKRELTLFPLMANCKHRKHEKACSRCYQTEEVCALCRKLSA